ncbi:phospholipase D family protein [Thiorhodococcus minor]|uniref:Phospholipase D family protein n=1 Tax=Thiorhodococcus minor TaxID=57489 RepID=A0A6M0K4W2_9GAMM|nr:phospholipase D family protein [Thiorhodococcus minor]NEV64321.1 phospholipase D family protein [Thiorhodococcus minor]
MPSAHSNALHRLAFPLGLLAGLVLGGCASLPTEVTRPSSAHSDLDREPSRLARHAGPYLRAHPGESGLWLLGLGLDAFAARLLLADAADRTIDVQYYLYHDDVTGRILTERLLRAADRGVRVRLLLDDMTTQGIEARLATLDAHPNIAVRIVNPFASRDFRALETLTRFDTVTRRMHNKSFTVDDTMTIVGGRNIGDEYFDAHEDVNFGDLDVLAVGPAAIEVGKQFDLYWNSDLAYPIQSLAGGTGDLEALRADLRAYIETQIDSPYAERARSSELVRDFLAGTLPFQWGQALVYYDLPEKLVTDPEDRSTHMAPQVLPKTLGALEHDLLIFTPYFVPGDHGVMVLTGLEKRGVQVRVLTNSLASTDVGAVHAGYARYRKPLLQGGVELYELKPESDTTKQGKFNRLDGSSGASLHAKTTVFDREALFVGSANLDPRSGKLNTELGILFKSDPLAQGVGVWFDANRARIAYRVSLDQSHCGDRPQCKGRLQWTDEEGGRSVIYLKDPETGALTRFFVTLIALLPIEGQL